MDYIATVDLDAHYAADHDVVRDVDTEINMISYYCNTCNVALRDMTE